MKILYFILLFFFAQMQTCFSQTNNETITIHYQRIDNNYKNWALHLWGDAIDFTVNWNKPFLFQSTDDYGAVTKVPIKNFDKQLFFIIHKGDLKDIPTDRVFPNLVNNKEFWLKEGNNEIWISKPLNKTLIKKASVTENNSIKIQVINISKFNIKELEIKTHDNNKINIKNFQINSNEVEVFINDNIDLNKNYLITLNESFAWAYLSHKILNNKFYYEANDLGATILNNNNVLIKLWSPPATKVIINIFDKNNQNKLLISKDLIRTNNGVWEVTLKPNIINEKSLDGYYYQYSVTAYGKTLNALDPYAKSMAAFNPQSNDKIGKAAIIDINKTIPSTHNENKYINNQNMIAYEVHVRDFTIDPNLNIDPKIKGTYAGFIKKIDHLKNLGITHVQFLPLQNYYTVDENNKTYTDKDNKTPNYNWGYDPHNYFTPEGFLSTDANNPYTRIIELKQLINNLHKNNIGVIMDVVYNHTYGTEVFENVCPGCYYRLNDKEEISTKTGAGPSLETRNKMVRKLILDSLAYYVKDFHIDGFRFDLLGFIDKETITMARKMLGDNIIMHGEAWEFTDLPTNEAPTKSNLPDINIAAFSDTTRDSFTGAMENKGFVQGLIFNNHKVRSGIIGNISNYNSDYNNDSIPDINLSSDPYDKFARHAHENLNYLDIHDGYTLWDKLNLSQKMTIDERIALEKMALTMLFTSQGKIILHAGVEMARTKIATNNDPELSRTHNNSNTIKEFDINDIIKYHENSYKSSDFTNMLKWNRLENEKVKELYNYLQTLIKLKLSTKEFNYIKAKDIDANIKFINNVKPEQDLINNNYSNYKSFNELEEFTIKFINGVPNTKWYLAGEVNEGDDKNPANNVNYVVFNYKGEASITFFKKDINKFDLKAWADPTALQIKLVKNKGTWDYHPKSYTQFGNNAIRPNLIQKNSEITIDLIKIDNTPGLINFNEKAIIAYEIAKKYIVIHNAEKTTETITSNLIIDNKKWELLLGNAKILNHKIEIAPQTSVIIKQK